MAIKDQKLYIGTYKESPEFYFENDDIVSISGEMGVDLSGNNLSIDTLTPEVHFEVRLPEVLKPTVSIVREAYAVKNYDPAVILSPYRAYSQAVTDVKLKSGLKVVIDFQILNANDIRNVSCIPLFGAFDSKNKCFGAFFLKHSDGNLYLELFDSFYSSTYASSKGYDSFYGHNYIYADTERHTLSYELYETGNYIGGWHAYYDEDSAGSNFSSANIPKFASNTYLSLFSVKNSSGTRPYDNMIWGPTAYDSLANDGSVIIYSCKVYDNGELIANIVPDHIGEDIGIFANNETGATFGGTIIGGSSVISYNFIPYLHDVTTTMQGLLTSDNKLLAGHYTDNIRRLGYGTPIYYYSGNTFVGKFFLDTIERVSKNIYRLNTISIIGILDKQESLGGFYSGVPFSDVVDDILTAKSYSPYDTAEYISATGNQYINTGIFTQLAKDGNTNIIEIDFKLDNISSSTQWLFGNDSFRIGVNTSGIVSWTDTSTWYNPSSETHTYSASIGTTRHKIKLENNMIYLDGTYIGSGGPSSNKLMYDTEIDESAYSLYVFAANDSMSGIGKVNGKLYGFSISKRGKNVGIYTPYVKSNVGAMYDSVTGSFFESATSSPFIATLYPHILPVNPFDIEYEHGIDDLLVVGWLPCASKRSNLHQLLFANNVSIVKRNYGGMLFTYASPSVSKKVKADDVYEEGNIEYLREIENVRVTEHAFYYLPTSERETLFDNSGQGTRADYSRVLFSNAPIYVPSLQTSGTGVDNLVVHEANENFAIVSGIGTLTGIPYVHSTRVISKKPISSDNILEINEIEVNDCTLVTALNSQKIMEKMWNYRSATDRVKNSFVYNGEKCGEYVEIYNPYGEIYEGFIEKMSLNTSAKIKADAEILIGYDPVIGSADYNKFVILTGSGTWSLPSGVTKLRAILIGGGQGGGSGCNGSNGNTSSFQPDSMIPVPGGEGGDPGIPGEGGWIYVVDIQNPEQTYYYNCGVGGEGGDPDYQSTESNPGQNGTHTTFGNYSSSLGSKSSVGIMNLFTGAVYGIPGYNDGVKGGQGGLLVLGAGEQNISFNGEDVVFEGSIYRGGRGQIGVDTSLSTCGGGAAVGNDGFNGGTPGAHSEGPGGSGGNGASVGKMREKASIYGQGGFPGHGGGGGGNAGEGNEQGTPGIGGYGGPGGTGADGCIIIYY